MEQIGRHRAEFYPGPGGGRNRKAAFLSRSEPSLILLKTLYNLKIVWWFAWIPDRVDKI